MKLVQIIRQRIDTDPDGLEPDGSGILEGWKIQKQTN